jgi:solute carrier family 25 phosphate transporter 23/24/25/41
LTKAHNELLNAKNAVELVQSVESNRRQSAELLVLIMDLKRRIAALEENEARLARQEQESYDELTVTLKRFMCGGFAGAVSRTCVAPIDRVKILRQTQFIQESGILKYGSMWETAQTVLKEEGPKGLWRGNVTNVLRVIPYSACQFTSYDVFKAKMVGEDGHLSSFQRVIAGALAGITATTVTHPLDVIRLRLAVETNLKGSLDAVRSIYAENGARTFLKGYFPSVLSLAPFIAINFASFDILKQEVYKGKRPSTLGTLGLGAAAGLFAQSVCYPLDLVRRRMQLRGKVYSSTPMAFYTIVQQEGVKGLYKGMVPNAVKIIPNNAIRFLAYDTATRWAKVSKAGGGD